MDSRAFCQSFFAWHVVGWAERFPSMRCFTLDDDELEKIHGKLPGFVPAEDGKHFSNLAGGPHVIHTHSWISL